MVSETELKVKIIPDVQEIPNKIRGRADSIKKAGGFDNDVGQRREKSLNGLLASIDEFIKKGELTKKEIKELNGLVDDAYEILKKAAVNTEKVSDSMKKLLGEQATALKKVQEQTKRRNEILEKGKTNKEGTSFTSLTGFKDRAKELGIRKVNKDGSISKSTVNDYETIKANIASGKAKYVDSKGQDLTKNPE